MKTAILVDGAYYRRLAKYHFGDKSPEQRAEELIRYCKYHLRVRNSKNSFTIDEDGKKVYAQNDLYRIFYYDCKPVDKKVYHPLLKKTVDLSKSPVYQWTNSFLEELKKKRKVALRLGFLAADEATFVPKTECVKKLFRNDISISEVTENDFQISIKQKSVDMKIGIDIASLAYKKQVDQIILIAGDSDFVPAAKLARREGIDFILDPMGKTINSELFEHIDGLRSNFKKFKFITEKNTPSEE